VSAVEVIAAALAAGAAAGMQDTASAAVQDAYRGLKDRLRRGFGGREDAVAALETDETEPTRWLARIGDALTDSGAADDPDVAAAARRLLVLADPATAKTFHIQVDTNHGAVGEFHAPVTFHQGPTVPPAHPAAS
jgi:hypothetical protein